MGHHLKILCQTNLEQVGDLRHLLATLYQDIGKKFIGMRDMDSLSSLRNRSAMSFKIKRSRSFFQELQLSRCLSGSCGLENALNRTAFNLQPCFIAPVPRRLSSSPAWLSSPALRLPKGVPSRGRWRWTSPFATSRECTACGVLTADGLQNSTRTRMPASFTIIKPSSGRQPITAGTPSGILAGINHPVGMAAFTATGAAGRFIRTRPKIQPRTTTSHDRRALPRPPVSSWTVENIGVPGVNYRLLRLRQAAQKQKDRFRQSLTVPPRK